MSVAARKMVREPDFPTESVLPVSPLAIIAVAYVIADTVNPGRGYTFYMTLAHLADIARVSRNTARRVVQHLVAAGVLRVYQQDPGEAITYQWIWKYHTLPPVPPDWDPPGTPHRLRLVGGDIPPWDTSPTTVGDTPTKVVGPTTLEHSKEHKTRTGKRTSRRASQRRARTPTQGAEMDFGAELPDESKGRVPPRRTAKEVPFGGDTESQPKPVRKKTSAGVVISRFHERWQGVREKWPRYFNEKGLDSRAFAGFLSQRFFGEDATDPMPVENVVILVDAFMDDLFRGQFWLEPGQPAWQSFSRRWNNYTPKIPSAPAAPTPGHLRYRWDGDELVEVG